MSQPEPAQCQDQEAASWIDEGHRLCSGNDGAQQPRPPPPGTEDPRGCRSGSLEAHSRADTWPPRSLAPRTPGVLSPVSCTDPQALHAHPPTSLSACLPSALWSQSPPVP